MRTVITLVALVFVLRAPFLNQAVSGDDVYYLAAAYHGLIDPLHPNHTTYIFEGRNVSFQGYPHPPGNAWFLAALLSIWGDVYEAPFHAAYLVFSFAAVLGCYLLARRFTPHPLRATALFAVTPAFVVNGNGFESDVPLVGLWTLGAAAFIYSVDRGGRRLLILAGICLAASGLIAMQSVLFVPILLGYSWLRHRRVSFGWILAACAPLIALAGWQVFERVTSGQFPAAVSAGYVSSYGYDRVALKLRNAAQLAIHAAFLVLPVLLPSIVFAVWRGRRDRDTLFLASWAVFWLAGASVLFFAGSARYLLPMAAPVAILASGASAPLWGIGFACQLLISLGLAVVNWQHWDAYRRFASELEPQTKEKRVWVDAEWGLRHYLEAEGALPIHRDQWIPTGDLVVESEMAYPAPYGHGGRVLVPIASAEIQPAIPLRLIGLDAHSGFSTLAAGWLPYDFRGGLIDRVHAYRLDRFEPTLSHLPMNAPEAEAQIVSGIYQLEAGKWRWMAKEGEILLKSPRHPSRLEVQLYLPEKAPARAVEIAVVGGPRMRKVLPAPGSYTLSLPVDATDLSPVAVKISVDRTFQPPGESRQLGIILNGAGFAP